MRVALGSIVRNATPYLPDYYARMRALADALAERGDTLRVILAEGDSVDGTWRMAEAMRWPAGSEVFQREHGGPMFGSVIVPQRMAQMAYVQNGVRERVQPDDDAFVYVEADLWWEPATMLALLEHLDAPRIVAPLALHHTGRFYDSWGYRLNGRAFAFHPPYHPDLPDPLGEALIPLDTAGSCLAMPASVARRVRFQPEDCIVGLCRDAAAQGIPTYLDPRVAVVHPPDGAD